MGLQLAGTAEQWPALKVTAQAVQHGRGGHCHDAHNSLGQDVVTTAGQIGASQSNPKTAAIQVPLSFMKNGTGKDSTNSICCPFASPLARRKWHPNLGHGMRVMSIPGPRSLATRKTCPATSNFLPAQLRATTSASMSDPKTCTTRRAHMEPKSAKQTMHCK